jgi:crotonobetainyl-CoA:carnitine CoA-transferase CaiB-like acyl-CoA transferase
MRAAAIPCGELRTVNEATTSPEALERGIVSRIPHETLGWVPNVALPIRYGRTPLADPVAAPRIGQHTAEVLADWLGRAESQAAAARDAPSHQVAATTAGEPTPAPAVPRPTDPRAGAGT